MSSISEKPTSKTSAYEDEEMDTLPHSTMIGQHTDKATEETLQENESSESSISSIGPTNLYFNDIGTKKTETTGSEEENIQNDNQLETLMPILNNSETSKSIIGNKETLTSLNKSDTSKMFNQEELQTTEILYTKQELNNISGHSERSFESQSANKQRNTTITQLNLTGTSPTSIYLSDKNIEHIKTTKLKIENTQTILETDQSEKMRLTSTTFVKEDRTVIDKDEELESFETTTKLIATESLNTFDQQGPEKLDTTEKLYTKQELKNISQFLESSLSTDSASPVRSNAVTYLNVTGTSLTNLYLNEINDKNIETSELKKENTQTVLETDQSGKMRLISTTFVKEDTTVINKDKELESFETTMELIATETLNTLDQLEPDKLDTTENLYTKQDIKNVSQFLESSLATESATQGRSNAVTYLNVTGTSLTNLYLNEINHKNIETSESRKKATQTVFETVESREFMLTSEIFETDVTTKFGKEDTTVYFNRNNGLESLKTTAVEQEELQTVETNKTFLTNQELKNISEFLETTLRPQFTSKKESKITHLKYISSSTSEGEKYMKNTLNTDTTNIRQIYEEDLKYICDPCPSTVKIRTKKVENIQSSLVLVEATTQKELFIPTQAKNTPELDYTRDNSFLQTYTTEETTTHLNIEDYTRESSVQDLTFVCDPCPNPAFKKRAKSTTEKIMEEKYISTKITELTTAPVIFDKENKLTALAEKTIKLHEPNMTTKIWAKPHKEIVNYSSLTSKLISDDKLEQTTAGVDYIFNTKLKNIFTSLVYKETTTGSQVNIAKPTKILNNGTRSKYKTEIIPSVAPSKSDLIMTSLHVSKKIYTEEKEYKYITEGQKKLLTASISDDMQEIEQSTSEGEEGNKSEKSKTYDMENTTTQEENAELSISKKNTFKETKQNIPTIEEETEKSNKKIDETQKNISEALEEEESMEMAKNKFTQEVRTSESEKATTNKVDEDKISEDDQNEENTEKTEFVFVNATLGKGELENVIENAKVVLTTELMPVETNQNSGEVIESSSLTVYRKGATRKYANWYNEYPEEDEETGSALEEKDEQEEDDTTGDIKRIDPKITENDMKLKKMNEEHRDSIDTTYSMATRLTTESSGEISVISNKQIHFGRVKTSTEKNEVTEFIHIITSESENFIQNRFGVKTKSYETKKEGLNTDLYTTSKDALYVPYKINVDEKELKNITGPKIIATTSFDNEMEENQKSTSELGEENEMEKTEKYDIENNTTQEENEQVSIGIENISKNTEQNISTIEKESKESNKTIDKIEKNISATFEEEESTKLSKNMFTQEIRTTELDNIHIITSKSPEESQTFVQSEFGVKTKSYETIQERFHTDLSTTSNKGILHVSNKTNMEKKEFENITEGQKKVSTASFSNKMEKIWKSTSELEEKNELENTEIYDMKKNTTQEENEEFSISQENISKETQQNIPTIQRETAESNKEIDEIQKNISETFGEEEESAKLQNNNFTQDMRTSGSEKATTNRAYEGKISGYDQNEGNTEGREYVFVKLTTGNTELKNVTEGGKVVLTQLIPGEINQNLKEIMKSSSSTIYRKGATIKYANWYNEYPADEKETRPVLEEKEEQEKEKKITGATKLMGQKITENYLRSEKMKGKHSESVETTKSMAHESTTGSIGKISKISNTNSGTKEISTEENNEGTEFIHIITSQSPEESKSFMQSVFDVKTESYETIQERFNTGLYTTSNIDTVSEMAKHLSSKFILTIENTSTSKKASELINNISEKEVKKETPEISKNYTMEYNMQQNSSKPKARTQSTILKYITTNHTKESEKILESNHSTKISKDATKEMWHHVTNDNSDLYPSFMTEKIIHTSKKVSKPKYVSTHKELSEESEEIHDYLEKLTAIEASKEETIIKQTKPFQNKKLEITSKVYHTLLSTELTDEEEITEMTEGVESKKEGLLISETESGIEKKGTVSLQNEKAEKTSITYGEKDEARKKYTGNEEYYAISQNYTAKGSKLFLSSPISVPLSKEGLEHLLEGANLTKLIEKMPTEHEVSTPLNDHSIQTTVYQKGATKKYDKMFDEYPAYDEAELTSKNLKYFSVQHTEGKGLQTERYFETYEFHTNAKKDKLFTIFTDSKQSSNTQATEFAERTPKNAGLSKNPKIFTNILNKSSSVNVTLQESATLKFNIFSENEFEETSIGTIITKKQDKYEKILKEKNKGNPSEQTYITTNINNFNTHPTVGKESDLTTKHGEFTIENENLGYSKIVKSGTLVESDKKEDNTIYTANEKNSTETAREIESEFTVSIEDTELKKYSKSFKKNTTKKFDAEKNDIQTTSAVSQYEAEAEGNKTADTFTSSKSSTMNISYEYGSVGIPEDANSNYIINTEEPKSTEDTKENTADQEILTTTKGTEPDIPDMDSQSTLCELCEFEKTSTTESKNKMSGENTILKATTEEGAATTLEASIEKGAATILEASTAKVAATSLEGSTAESEATTLEVSNVESAATNLEGSIEESANTTLKVSTTDSEATASAENSQEPGVSDKEAGQLTSLASESQNSKDSGETGNAENINSKTTQEDKNTESINSSNHNDVTNIKDDGVESSAPNTEEETASIEGRKNNAVSEENETTTERESQVSESDLNKSDSSEAISSSYEADTTTLKTGIKETSESDSETLNASSEIIGLAKNVSEGADEAGSKESMTSTNMVDETIGSKGAIQDASVFNKEFGKTTSLIGETEKFSTPVEPFSENTFHELDETTSVEGSSEETAEITGAEDKDLTDTTSFEEGSEANEISEGLLSTENFSESPNKTTELKISNKTSKESSEISTTKDKTESSDHSEEASTTNAKETSDDISVSNVKTSDLYEHGTKEISTFNDEESSVNKENTQVATQNPKLPSTIQTDMGKETSNDISVPNIETSDLFEQRTKETSTFNEEESSVHKEHTQVTTQNPKLPSTIQIDVGKETSDDINVPIVKTSDLYKQKSKETSTFNEEESSVHKKHTQVATQNPKLTSTIQIDVGMVGFGSTPCKYCHAGSEETKLTEKLTTPTEEIGTILETPEKQETIKEVTHDTTQTELEKAKTERTILEQRIEDTTFEENTSNEEKYQEGETGTEEEKNAGDEEDHDGDEGKEEGEQKKDTNKEEQVDGKQKEENKEEQVDKEKEEENNQETEEAENKTENIEKEKEEEKSDENKKEEKVEGEPENEKVEENKKEEEKPAKTEEETKEEEEKKDAKEEKVEEETEKGKVEEKEKKEEEKQSEKEQEANEATKEEKEKKEEKDEENRKEQKIEEGKEKLLESTTLEKEISQIETVEGENTKSVTETTVSKKVSYKPVVIVVNDSGNKISKLNQTILESILNRPINDVDLRYIDVNTGENESSKIITKNNPLKLSVPYESCKKVDYINGRNCFCNIQIYMNTLLQKINHKEKIKSKENYCENFLTLKNGLLIVNSIKPVERTRRGLIFLENFKKKAENVEYETIDGLFEDEYQLNISDVNLFCLPGETVKIRCTTHNDEKGMNWKFRPLSSSKDELLMDKGAELVIHGVSVKNTGNYTCSKEDEKNTSEKQHWHELEMITFPIYDINMNIFYKFNDSCSLKIGDVLYTYLPKIVGPLLCSNDNDLCSVDIKRPRCLTRADDNFFNVTMNAKISSDFVTTLHDNCGINCKLRIYENLVNVIYKNTEILENVPVYSMLDSSHNIEFLPNINGKKGSPVGVKRPKIVVFCPSGFGLESKRQSVCVACPSHTFSGDDEAFCKTCPGGQYQPEPGSKSCIQCNSPVDNEMCLRMLYTDTKLFKIYVGVAFGFIVLMVIVILVWTSGHKDNADLKTSYFEGSLRHRAMKKKDPDIEAAVREPLLGRSPKKSKPPQLPPVDF